MSVEVLMEIVLKSGLVAGAALLLVIRLKGLPASQRAWIAHIGLLLTLLMPVLVLAGPDLALSGPWSRTVEAAPAAFAAAGPVGAVPAIAATPAPAAAATFDTGALVLAGWALVAGLLGLGLATGLIRLLNLKREASVLTDGDWLCALAQAQHRMGMKQGTALLLSKRLSSPVSWGLLRPTIVLSAAALKSPDRARAILAHELAHVLRMDWVNLLVSRLATAVFWFNPLVWLLAWQAHELREEAADDVVLRGDVEGPDYAALLVDFARSESRGRAMAAHGVAPGKGSLRRRLLRVLDRDARRDPARPLWVAACALGALIVAAPLAAFTPVDRIAGEPAIAIAFTALPAPDEAPASAFADTPPGPVAASVPEDGDTTDKAGDRISERGPQAVALAQASPAPEPRLSPEMLGQMRMFGVTPQWIAGMESELPGVRGLSAQQMVALAIHGVTPGWIRSMRAAGYGDLSHEQMVAFAIHGVTPAYVRELEGAGYRNLPADQLVELRLSGVDADSIRRMEAEGLRVEPDVVIRERPGRRGRRAPPPVPTPPAPPSPPAILP